MSDMTRKDAIRRLKRLLKCGDGTYEFKVEINTDDQKAIQFAIDSLETDEAYQLMYEQPELCEDCISREATKEAIRKRFPSLHDRCEVNIVINSMPSILPKTDVPDNNVGEISDCISRKDTIEYLKQVTVTDGITFETGFKQILLDIENMPSILPKTNFNYSPASEWEHDHEILKAYSDGQASIITVLEAIKAEIEQSRYGLINDGLDVALKIIDKHISEMGDMAEIEPQESEDKE